MELDGKGGSTAATSRMQDDPQPSPGMVFPSSHCSGARAMPSPQMLSPATMVSSIMHRELQPSPESVLPSSHCSSVERILSPQTMGTVKEKEEPSELGTEYEN